jgi:hypothetical protein
LRRENPVGKALQCAGSAGKKAVSDARRGAGLGRAERQSQPLKHGLYTKAAIEERQQLRALIKRSRSLLDEIKPGGKPFASPH